MSVPDASLPATPPHAPSTPLNGVSLPGAPLPEAEAAHELPGAPSGDAEPAHAALRHVLEAPARNWVHAEPPPIPLPQATNSCVYMPLLLDAAGLLHGRARVAWRAHPSFAPWWHGAVTALLARPFLSVRDVQSAVEHGLLGQPNHTRERLQFFLAWCSLRAAQVTSLAALLREVGDPHEGYYLPGPLQEALLALLLGEAGVLALARLLDDMRAPVDMPAPAPAEGVADCGPPPPRGSAEPLPFFFFFYPTPFSACYDVSGPLPELPH